MDDVTSDPTTSSSSSLTAPPRPRLGFLSLPPEIRLEIYALLLVLPPYSKNRPAAPPPHRPRLPPPHLPPHPRRSHPHPLLPQHLRRPPLPARLLPAPAPLVQPRPRGPALALVRRFHLTLRLDCDLPFTRERAARAFSGADELTVEAVQSMFLGVGCANLRVLEGVRGVRRVRIMGSTTGFEEYVRWLEGCMMTPEGGEVVGFEREDEAMSHRLNIPVWPVTMKEIQAHG
ncbi:hypothetical protein ACCO45_008378 [Purpureocillium lilacinum]|uniref:Uncharacterized protein n=1 Tax=Purpureocillium lilacinum TaxID=33203 RepID=A0ACC4DR76_PURLI